MHSAQYQYPIWLTLLQGPVAHSLADTDTRSSLTIPNCLTHIWLSAHLLTCSTLIHGTVPTLSHGWHWENGLKQTPLYGWLIYGQAMTTSLGKHWYWAQYQHPPLTDIYANPSANILTWLTLIYGTIPLSLCWWWNKIWYKYPLWSNTDTWANTNSRSSHWYSKPVLTYSLGWNW